MIIVRAYTKIRWEHLLILDKNHQKAAQKLQPFDFIAAFLISHCILIGTYNRFSLLSFDFGYNTQVWGYNINFIIF